MEDTTFAIAATERQLSYARSLAQRNGVNLPWEVQLDRRSLSAWIDVQAKMRPMETDGRPTSKQVAFAEKIARFANGAYYVINSLGSFKASVNRNDILPCRVKRRTNKIIHCSINNRKIFLGSLF